LTGNVSAGSDSNQVGHVRENIFTPRLRCADLADLNALLTRRCPRSTSAMFFKGLLPLLEFGRDREGIDLSKVVLTHHNLQSLGKRAMPLNDRPQARCSRSISFSAMFNNVLCPPVA
jgi:hypothetical protein